MSTQVKVDRDGAVLVVAMNRPEKKNALTQAMYEAMVEAINSARTDAGIRCVLIKGTPGTFSAGSDLSDPDRNSTERGSAVRYTA